MDSDEINWLIAAGLFIFTAAFLTVALVGDMSLRIYLPVAGFTLGIAVWRWLKVEP